MKKTLLAAALLAGFASAAQAATKVTLYGVVDQAIRYKKLDGAEGRAEHSSTKIKSNIQSGSHWGLRGTEDLGGGVQAVFQLEAGFDASNGNQLFNGRMFGRQTTVGVQSASWGRFDLGRQTNISSKYLTFADPFEGSGPGAYGDTFGFADAVRYDDMAMYQTPVINGFQFGIGYSFSVDDSAYRHNGEQPLNQWTWNAEDNVATTDSDRAVTAGLKYANGPWTAALTYEQRNVPNNLYTDNGSREKAKPRSYALGASYDFDFMTAHAAYARTTDISPFASGVAHFDDEAKTNSYLVGVSVPLDSVTDIMASWQAADPSNKKNTANKLKMMQVYSLGVTHSLSKRTNLYAYGSVMKHYHFFQKRDGREVAAGIRHQF